MSDKKKLLKFIPDAKSHRVLLVVVLIVILLITLKLAS